MWTVWSSGSLRALYAGNALCALRARGAGNTLCALRAGGACYALWALWSCGSLWSNYAALKYSDCGFFSDAVLDNNRNVICTYRRRRW